LNLLQGTFPFKKRSHFADTPILSKKRARVFEKNHYQAKSMAWAEVPIRGLGKYEIRFPDFGNFTS
jgi:hypothetical protein